MSYIGYDIDNILNQTKDPLDVKGNYVNVPKIISLWKTRLFMGKGIEVISKDENLMKNTSLLKSLGLDNKDININKYYV